MQRRGKRELDAHRRVFGRHLVVRTACVLFCRCPVAFRDGIMPYQFAVGPEDEDVELVDVAERIAGRTSSQPG